MVVAINARQLSAWAQARERRLRSRLPAMLVFLAGFWAVLIYKTGILSATLFVVGLVALLFAGSIIVIRVGRARSAQALKKGKPPSASAGIPAQLLLARFPANVLSETAKVRAKNSLFRGTISVDHSGLSWTPRPSVARALGPTSHPLVWPFDEISRASVAPSRGLWPAAYLSLAGGFGSIDMVIFDAARVMPWIDRSPLPQV